LHQFFAAPMVFASTIGLSNLSQRYILESKAMRKVSEDQTLILVVENASATHGLNYRLDIRILSKVG